MSEITQANTVYKMPAKTATTAQEKWIGAQGRLRIYYWIEYPMRL